MTLYTYFPYFWTDLGEMWYGTYLDNTTEQKSFTKVSAVKDIHSGIYEIFFPFINFSSNLVVTST